LVSVDSGSTVTVPGATPGTIRLGTERLRRRCFECGTMVPQFTLLSRTNFILIVPSSVMKGSRSPNRFPSVHSQHSQLRVCPEMLVSLPHLVDISHLIHQIVGLLQLSGQVLRISRFQKSRIKLSPCRVFLLNLPFYK